MKITGDFTSTNNWSVVLLCVITFLTWISWHDIVRRDIVRQESAGSSFDSDRP